MASIGDQLRPSADELCVALLFGQLHGEQPLDPAEATVSTRAVLERQLTEAMQRGPLWVAYSGGRDSSALLAIAASVARREGFELPVAVTMTFPELPESHEEAWQRLVLDHLDLADQWHPLRLTDELDLIGANAQRVLRPHGVILPPNAHAFLPMLDAVGPDGTLVSGGNGDELMEGVPQRLSSAVLSRRRIPRSQWTEAAIHDLPGRFIGRAIRKRSVMRFLHWVRMPVLSRLVRAEIADRDESAIRFDRLLQDAWLDREFRAGRHAVVTLAQEAGGQLLQPFGDREVMTAFARDWGYRFPGSRRASLDRLVGDLLPPSILDRSSKAEFARAFVAAGTRAFIEDWDRTGVDPERVDLDALQAEWANERPHYCSLPLLHHAWLTSQGLPTYVS